MRSSSGGIARTSPSSPSPRRTTRREGGPPRRGITRLGRCGPRLAGSLLEIERRRQIQRGGVPLAQWIEPPAILDQRQDRGRVVDVMVHEAVARERRND